MKKIYLTERGIWGYSGKTGPPPQPVGDEDCRPPGSELTVFLINPALGNRVQSRGGLIQHHDAAVLVQGLRAVLGGVPGYLSDAHHHRQEHRPGGGGADRPA